MYKVQIGRSVKKSLKKIPSPYYLKIKFAILDLGKDPRPQGFIKLKKRDGYRIRIGSYRVLYEIEDKILRIKVVAVGHRKDIYNSN